jgi:hypothetical protein
MKKTTWIAMEIRKGQPSRGKWVKALKTNDLLPFRKKWLKE